MDFRKIKTETTVVTRQKDQFFYSLLMKLRLKEIRMDIFQMRLRLRMNQ